MCVCVCVCVCVSVRACVLRVIKLGGSLNSSSVVPSDAEILGMFSVTISSLVVLARLSW